jgi:hypothetical protein
MKKSILTDPKLSWTLVADQVSRKLGRKYSGSYCREVATGFRNSSVISPVLQDLGVMKRSRTFNAKRSPTNAAIAA